MRVGGCLFNVQQIFKMLRIEKARSEKKTDDLVDILRFQSLRKPIYFEVIIQKLCNLLINWVTKKKSGNKRVEMRKKGNTFTQEIKLILIAFNQEIQDIIGWLCFKRRRIAIKVIDDTLS